MDQDNFGFDGMTNHLISSGFWFIQVNVIFCEKRRRERGKKREKEREKKKRDP